MYVLGIGTGHRYQEQRDRSSCFYSQVHNLLPNIKPIIHHLYSGVGVLTLRPHEPSVQWGGGPHTASSRTICTVGWGSSHCVLTNHLYSGVGVLTLRPHEPSVQWGGGPHTASSRTICTVGWGSSHCVLTMWELDTILARTRDCTCCTHHQAALGVRNTPPVGENW